MPLPTSPGAVPVRCAACDAPVRPGHEPRCPYCGADPVSGAGRFVAAESPAEQPSLAAARRLKPRLIGAAELLVGGALSTCFFLHPPGGRFGALAMIASMAMLGHGLLTVITGTWIAYLGGETEDERQS